MPKITPDSHSRLMEIEKALKIEKPRQTTPFLSSALGGKILKVTNQNGSSFIMPMPRGDSPIIEGLAARKAEEGSFNKAFSNLSIK